MKEKTGSTSAISKFKYFIRQIVKTNHLPDYEIEISDDDLVRFKLRKNYVELDDLPSISWETIRRGMEIVENSGCGLDFQEIKEQFSIQLIKGFKPENANGAFIGFVKKKVGNTFK